MKDTVLLEISNHALVFSLIDLEVSSTFRLPLLLRCSSISFFVNTGKLSRDLQHGTSFEVFTVGFSALSAIFDCCPPEPRFHDFARVFVTNAGKVYSFGKPVMCIGTTSCLQTEKYKYPDKSLKQSLLFWQMPSEFVTADSNCKEKEINCKKLACNILF